jgi:hypothetical protein
MKDPLMAQKAFAVFLQDLRDGRAHSELSSMLGELLAKVKETGKGGALSLSIKIKPAGRGQDVDKVTISDEVKLTLPKPERGDDFYWLTEDNDLSRNHPKQGSLELREAPAPTPSTFKEVAK